VSPVFSEEGGAFANANSGCGIQHRRTPADISLRVDCFCKVPEQDLGMIDMNNL